MLKKPFILSLTLMMMSGYAPAADLSPVPSSESDQKFISATSSLPALEAGQPLNARVFANYTGRKYRLGPNDVLSVAVYDSPEFTQEKILVMPDGNINIAPFGSINVAGMTIDELQRDLADRYKYYLNEPQVTVRLDQTKPFQVYVSGAVLRPGAYEMVTDITRNLMVNNSTPGVLLERKAPLLSNVLVAAGGLRPDADLEHVKIHNKFEDSTFEINLLDMVMNGNSDQDMFLIAGDTVEVPRLATPYAMDEKTYQAMLGSSVFQKDIPVKVYGFVNKPGLIMLDGAQSANLNSAIGMAGGYLNTDAPYAPDKVIISRVDANGHLISHTVDPRHDDVSLRPNDIVYVPSKTRPTVGRAFDYLARIVTPLAGIGNGLNSWALLFDPMRYNIRMTTR